MNRAAYIAAHILVAADEPVRPRSAVLVDGDRIVAVTGLREVPSGYKRVDLGPVWSGPSVARGRVYVGTGNTLFNPQDFEAFFPKKYSGVLYSFGLPGADEVSRLGAGSE